MSQQPKTKYLNQNSTKATISGTLNPSDIAYPQVMEQRASFEHLKTKIKRLVNAPINAKVIINSGATESIANCIAWAKNYNKYGVVVGSSFDHSTVEDNCKLYDVEYIKNLNSGVIDDKCSMIFITHVNPKTGEIANMNNFKTNVMNRYRFMYSEAAANTWSDNAQGVLQDQHDSSDGKNILQYKPIVVLDASQSIMKVPIDMESWGVNCVLFSLHKIGGPIGIGIMVVADEHLAPFKPLIAGKQQNGLRGGTFPLEQLLEYEYLFDETHDSIESRKSSWKRTVKTLRGAGLNVYEPQGNHLYNTILIDVGQCPLGIINTLAQDNIYVGNYSACANEGAKESESLSGGANVPGGTIEPYSKSIRLSFDSSKDLDESTVQKIVQAIRESKSTKT